MKYEWIETKNFFIEVHSLLVLTTIFTAIVLTTANKTDANNASEVQMETLQSDLCDGRVCQTIVSDKSVNGRAIKDSSNNSLEKSKRADNKGVKERKKDMYDVMRLHQTHSNIEYDKELKADQEKKEKGKLQTVGGVFGEIIAVIVSEVVKLFGNMVSDVAREVTAHGFVSVFKQFTDLTGISIPENIF